MKRKTNTFFAILFGLLIIGICALAKQIGTNTKDGQGDQPTSTDTRQIDSSFHTTSGNYYLFIARQSGCDRDMLRLLTQRPV